MALEILHLQPLAPDQFRDAYPDRPHAPGPQRTALRSGEVGRSSDRFELSDEARRAARTSEPPDLAFARKAMKGIPPLSDERRVDVIRRIQAGYTRWPEVLNRITDRIRAAYQGEA